MKRTPNMGSIIVIWGYDHSWLSTTEEPGTGLECEATKMKNSHFSWDPHKLCCEAQKRWHMWMHIEKQETQYKWKNYLSIQVIANALRNNIMPKCGSSAHLL